MKPLPCPASDWPRFSSLLDAYLELEPGQRAAWLDALPENDAPFKPSLRAVLSTGERRSGDWLDRPTGGDETVSPYVEGMRLGPWRLLRPLGSGGMGAVWLAAHADGTYERQVALKLPHAHLLAGAQRERFQRERDILAGLTDPRIARFYDAGISTDEGGDEQPWLALEYVQGTPITEHCAGHALSTRDRVALLREVAAAVQAAHARLVVHRDLKPANVLVTAASEVKLLDFGIAKLVDGDGDGDGNGDDNAGLIRMALT